MQVAIQYIPGTVDGSGNLNGIYYINVYDDSGSPTPGNNVQVSYQSEQGGTLGAVITTTIPGLSKKIYQGIVQTGSGPRLNYNLVGNITPGTPSPPVVSDLTIVNIQVTQKADSSGNNGKVNINATCSNQPLTYYIDDVEQSGSQNLTVAAGVHTAKVIDPYDNQVEQDFTVDQANEILLTGPNITSPLISRWNAVFNPIVFTYFRKDFLVTAIVQDDTTLNPKITVNGDVSTLIAGDFVYIDAGLTNGISAYQGAYKVLSIEDTSKIIIDTDYVAPADQTGFCNINKLRPYYKVVTLIKYVDPVTGRFNTITSINRPGIDGITKADISSFLQSILAPLVDLSDYTQINFRDYGLGGSYQISYAEVWDGNPGIYSALSNPYYCVWAAKQLGDQYGGNLANYVPQAAGNTNAKFLTDFVEPSHSVGFPFDLGFIYSELIAGAQVYYTIIELDINRQPLSGSPANVFLLNEDSSFILNQDGTKLLIARQNLFNTPIAEHIGVNRLLINQDFDPLAYFFTVALYKNNSGAVAQCNFVLDEQTGGSGFIDGNGQLKINGNEEFTLNSSVSIVGRVFPAGAAYSWEGFCQSDSVAANPKIRTQVYKDSVLIFDTQALAHNGASQVKAGIFQPGSQYAFITTTSSNTDTVTPVDIADNTPVDNSAVQLTELKTVRIDRKCSQNAYYMRWIGLSGAYEYYRFNYSQLITLDVQNPVVIKDYVDNWETQQGIERKISNDATIKVQLFADLIDNNDVLGLQSIKYSPIVQVLISSNPVKWQTVIVNSSTFTERDTQAPVNDFSITISLPSKNIQNQ